MRRPDALLTQPLRHVATDNATRPAIALCLHAYASAGFLVIGRWSFSRLAGGSAPTAIIEPRLWLCIALVLLLPFISGEKNGSAGTKLPSLTFSVSLTALLAYLLLSFLWAPDAALASFKGYEVVLTATAGCSVAYAARFDPALYTRHFWRALLGLTLLIAVAALASVGTGFDGRLATLGGGPNTFARLMLMLAVATFGPALLGYNRVRTGFIAGLAIILAILSGSRGGILALLCALAALTIFTLINSRRALFGAIIVGLAGSLIVLASPVGPLAMQVVEERLVNENLGGSSADYPVYSSGRNVLYANALRLWSSQPVTGAGLASFTAYGLGVYPHNFFLELLAEGGIAALVLGVAPLLAALVAMPRAIARCGPRTAALLIGLFVSAQFSGDLFDSRSLFVLAGLIAVQGSSRPRREPCGLRTSTNTS